MFPGMNPSQTPTTGSTPATTTTNNSNTAANSTPSTTSPAGAPPTSNPFSGLGVSPEVLNQFMGSMVCFCFLHAAVFDVWK